MKTKHHYTGLSDIPIYNFYKASNENNLGYLLKTYKEEVSLHDMSYLEKVWITIYDDYCLKTESAMSRQYFSLVDEINKEETRLFFVQTLVSKLTNHNKQDFGSALKKWGVSYNLKGKIVTQRASLERQIKAAKNKITRRKSELEAIKKREGKSSSITRQKLEMESMLNISIDTKKRTMEEWIEMKNMCQELIKERNKQARK